MGSGLGNPRVHALAEQREYPTSIADFPRTPLSNRCDLEMSLRKQALLISSQERTALESVQEKHGKSLCQAAKLSGGWPCNNDGQWSRAATRCKFLALPGLLACLARNCKIKEEKGDGERYALCWVLITALLGPPASEKKPLAMSARLLRRGAHRQPPLAHRPLFESPPVQALPYCICSASLQRFRCVAETLRHGLGPAVNSTDRTVPWAARVQSIAPSLAGRRMQKKAAPSTNMSPYLDMSLWGYPPDTRPLLQRTAACTKMELPGPDVCVVSGRWYLCT
ncbi:hypothetical protein BD289DRAFT_195900 [Coniella lustricola]|uniref:Uncharacterized protein n=1 Tax=Coniella lustricola TaxID=2025994 RepID=A0A2T3AM94_9PEZI|nr:hypothetical protein BD289DRAFT_195900 [Coniella lustricola]